MKPAENVEVVESGLPLSAESGSTMRVATPVVDAPDGMVKHVLPAPVDEFFAPAPEVSCAAPAPVAEHVAPEPVETYAALTPAMDFCTYFDPTSWSTDGVTAWGFGNLVIEILHFFFQRYPSTGKPVA